MNTNTVISAYLLYRYIKERRRRKRSYSTSSGSGSSSEEEESPPDSPEPQHNVNVASANHHRPERKLSSDIPEGREVIVRVYRYLQNEYRQLKEFTGNCCDLSVLENVLKRTADATGVSERTVTRILEEEENSEETEVSSDDAAPAKRQKMMVKSEDDDSILSLFIEESDETSANDQEHLTGQEDITVKMEPHDYDGSGTNSEQKQDVCSDIPRADPSADDTLCASEEVPVKMEPDPPDSSLQEEHELWQQSGSGTYSEQEQGTNWEQEQDVCSDVPRTDPSADDTLCVTEEVPVKMEPDPLDISPSIWRGSMT